MDAETSTTCGMQHPVYIKHEGFANARVCVIPLHDQDEQHPLLLTAETSSFTLIVCPLGRAAGSSPTSSAFLLVTWYI